MGIFDELILALEVGELCLKSISIRSFKVDNCKEKLELLKKESKGIKKQKINKIDKERIIIFKPKAKEQRYLNHNYNMKG